MTGPRRMTRRELRDLLVKRDGAACRWCGRPVRDPAEVGEKADNAATVDHLLTRREGGDRRDPRNAVISCNRCNRQRGCLSVGDWRAVLLRRRLARWWRAVEWWAPIAVLVAWWAPTLLARWLGWKWGRARHRAALLLIDSLTTAGCHRAARWACRREVARRERLTWGECFDDVARSLRLLGFAYRLRRRRRLIAAGRKREADRVGRALHREWSR